jgi:hypothetical protein
MGPPQNIQFCLHTHNGVHFLYSIETDKVNSPTVQHNPFNFQNKVHQFKHNLLFKVPNVIENGVFSLRLQLLSMFILTSSNVHV